MMGEMALTLAQEEYKRLRIEREILEKALSLFDRPLN
jgi:hypothetical protein